MEQSDSEQKIKIFSWEKLIALSLYTLVFLAPLFFLPWGVYPVSFNKQSVVIALILIAFFSYLGKSLNDGKILYKKGNILIFGFLALATISLFFSQSFNVSLFGFSGAETDSFINILSFVLLYVLLASVVNEKNFRSIITVYAVSLTLLVAYQFLQLFGTFILPFDFTQFIDFTPATASLYDLIIFFEANLILIISILLSGTPISKIKKLLLSLLAFSFFIYILLINYTFVWILLAISLVAILVLKLYKDKIKIKGQHVLMAVLTIFIFLYFSNENLIRPSYLQFNIPSLISLTRAQNVTIIKDSYSDIKNALLGSGPNTFVYEYLKLRPTNLNQISNFWTIRFNSGSSLVLTYLVTLGAIASILFLLFSLGIAVSSRKSFFSPIFIYLILIFLFYNASYLLILMFFASAGIYQALHGKTREINLLATPQRIFLLSLTTIVLMGGVVFAFYYGSQRLAASMYYDLGIRNINSGKSDEGISKLAKAVLLDRRTGEYYRGLSQALLTKGDVVNAVHAGQAAILLNTIDSLNYINTARIYESLIAALSAVQKPTDQQKENLDNAYKAALDNYQIAVKFDPKNPDIHLNIAVLHSSVNKIKEAKISVDNSLILKPDYANAYFLYSQIFEIEKNLTAAIEKAQKAKLYSNDVGILFQLGNLYYKNNQLHLARTEFENTISLFPSHSNSRYVLGLIYDAQGFKDKAIEQFEKILELNPDSEPVKNILENLHMSLPADRHDLPADR